MSDLAFVPYGLSEDDADEVIDAAEKLAEKLRDKSSKADGGGGSKRKVKEVSKEEYFESMKQLLQPISFDVFSLFNMPLSLQADHALTTCFRHHPSTKKPKLAGAAAAAEAAAARATELQVLPMAEETLSIELLAHLLADLRARIGVAVDRQEDPLLAVKFDPPNTGEGDVAPQNTADAMNPWELTQAMMARWAALGSHAHAIMLHLRAHHDTDETTEDGEDGAGGGGTPEFARRETMFACLESLVGVSRFLLKYAPPEDELGETMRQALALFVSTFDESATESLTLSSGGGRKKVAPGSLAYSCQSLMYLLGGIGECTTELACCKVVLEAMEAVLQVADHEAKAHWQLYRGLRQPLQAVVSTYARALLEETWDENTKLNASNVGYAMKLTLECAQEFDDTCDDMVRREQHTTTIGRCSPLACAHTFFCGSLRSAPDHVSHPQPPPVEVRSWLVGARRVGREVRSQPDPEVGAALLSTAPRVARRSPPAPVEFGVLVHGRRRLLSRVRAPRAPAERLHPADQANLRRRGQRGRVDAAIRQRAQTGQSDHGGDRQAPPRSARAGNRQTRERKEVDSLSDGPAIVSHAF